MREILAKDPDRRGARGREAQGPRHRLRLIVDEAGLPVPTSS